MDDTVAGLCTVCGRRPAGVHRVSLRGRVTCTSHEILAHCVFCGLTHPALSPPGWRPFTGGSVRCPDCAADAVETQEQARRLLPAVRREMAGIGLDLPERVLVRLVPPDRATALAGHPATGVLLGLTEQIVRDEDGTHVVEITIAAGTTPIYFGRAVAHEMGHAWLALRGGAPVDESIEEGLCELFAYAWLKRRGTSMAGPLRRQLRDNPDPLYGGGFRAVHAAVQRYGVSTVLDRLARTGDLP